MTFHKKEAEKIELVARPGGGSYRRLRWIRSAPLGTAFWLAPDPSWLAQVFDLRCLFCRLSCCSPWDAFLSGTSGKSFLLKKSGKTGEWKLSGEGWRHRAKPRKLWFLQVWSPTQFYSIGFLHSRIAVNECCF